MADSLEELKRKSVLSHRILTMTGSMGDITGHVFVRVPGSDEFLARCRNAEDWSPAYALPTALHRMDFEGKPTEDVGDYTIPPERYIGAELFKARPDVGCVIHAHPPGQVLCGMTGVDIQAIVGSQNWGGSTVARKGIPVYPRSVLIHSADLGKAMLAIMGNKDIVLLKGHGNVVVGRSVEDATVKAIQIENIARLCWQLALRRGNTPQGAWEIPWEDVDDQVSGAGGREAAAAQGGAVDRGTTGPWDYYVRMLRDGSLIPEESTVDLVQF